MNPKLKFLNSLIMGKNEINIKGKLLGIDPGDKYFGIAITDDNQSIANPLTVIKTSSITHLINQIKQICSKHNIKGIIIGYPLLENNKEGTQALKVKNLAEKMNKEINLPIVLWNEKLTSFESEMFLRNFKIKKKKKKDLINKLAATFILKDYIESVKKNS